MQPKTSTINHSSQVVDKIIDYVLKNKKLNFNSNELKHIILKYLNDKNSSTLREELTLRVAGVNFLEGKFSYDGYDDSGNFYEVKPINIRTNINFRKLDGNGGYSDMSWERHQKFLEDKPYILASGFVDGLLVYIIQFPYEALSKKIEYVLNSHKDMKYVRKVSFNFTDWKDSDDIVIKYVTDNSDLFNDKFLSKRLFSFLKGEEKDG